MKFYAILYKSSPIGLEKTFHIALESLPKFRTQKYWLRRGQSHYKSSASVSWTLLHYYKRMAYKH